MSDLEGKERLVHEFVARRNSAAREWQQHRRRNHDGRAACVRGQALYEAICRSVHDTSWHDDAEEDRVVVGAEGTGALKDGTVYSNSYGHRFTLTSPQIAAWREHCNTALFAKIVQRMRRSAGCGPELHVGW